MKKIMLLLLFGFITNSIHSQSISTDTLIGKNGVLKRFTPKDISYGQKLSFNLRMIYSMKNKNGITQEVCAYLNTKYGYVGILPVKNGDYSFNPNGNNFKLIVYSNSMQSFMFNTSKKGKKTVTQMPSMARNEIKMDNVTVKKESSASKKCTNLNIDGFGYNNSKSAANEKITMLLSDANLTGKLSSQNQLCYAGLGFYQVNGKTVLNMSIEKDGVKIALNKIESVNASVNSADFKKEESPISNEMMQEMMKKLKKQ